MRPSPSVRYFCITLYARLQRSEKSLCVCAACGRYEFRCESGECRSNLDQCDGSCDCRDCSDERNCSKSTYNLSYGCNKHSEQKFVIAKEFHLTQLLIFGREIVARTGTRNELGTVFRPEHYLLQSVYRVDEISKENYLHIDCEMSVEHS